MQNLAYGAINYAVVKVENTNVDFVEKMISKNLGTAYKESFFYDGYNDSYYLKNQVDKKEQIYFLKVYKDFDDVNIFLASAPRGDTKNSDIYSQIFQDTHYEYKKFNDELILNEYKFDFINYIRANKDLGFKVIAKKTKLYEKLVDNLDKKIVKDNKKFKRKPYVVDTKEIKLRPLDSTTVYEDGYKIIKNKYRLKEKTNRFAHAYEYLIVNDSDSVMVISEIETDEIINTKDILKGIYTDLDRWNALAMVGGLAGIVTFGGTNALCIPDWVRTMKVLKESSRFTKSFPESLEIKPHETARILTLSRRETTSKLKLTIAKNETLSSVEF